MTLQLINLSVDPVDHAASGIAEDLTFNEMESIAEIITEQILGVENCFPEHDEQDSDGNMATPFELVKALKYYLPLQQPKVLPTDVSDNHCLRAIFKRFSSQHNPEVLSPPPRYVAILPA